MLHFGNQLRAVKMAHEGRMPVKKIKVYEYSGCDTCRKALKYLDARGVGYEKRAIRETPPTTAELRKMLSACGGDVRRLFNISGRDYKELGLKDRLPKMGEDEALDLLASNGNLIKRPFVLGDGVALIGFKEAEWDRQFE